MEPHKIMSRALQSYRLAFTLIELLVVIAILSVLISLLVPSLRAAAEVSRSVSCRGHLRQLSAAAALYIRDWETQAFWGQGTSAPQET